MEILKRKMYTKKSKRRERKILLVDEVAKRARVSKSTIYREQQQSRKGCGTMPLAISAPKGKLRFLAAEIDSWLESKSQAAPPPVYTPRQRKQEAKDFQQRQADADKVLDRHRTGANRSGKNSKNNTLTKEEK